MSQSNKADTNDISEAVDTVCDDLVFKHEKREPAITDWCCLREQSVREAIQNLIAQETNKARLDELTWARDMAEKDITGHSLISLNYVNQRIQALTADKEQKP